jgi:hypothetical protein
MGSVNYEDLEETPKTVADATAMLARNAAHLAKVLNAHPYPSQD